MSSLNANNRPRRLTLASAIQLLSLLLLIVLPACVVSEADRNMLDNGFTQYSAQRFDAAQSAADQYIQKNPAAPNVAEAYYLRGLARMSRPTASDKAAAAQDLRTAIEKSNRDELKAKAHRALGDIAFDSQQWQQAIDRYQQSLTLVASSDAWLQYRYGAALQNLGQWEKSRPYFQRVISIKTEPLLTQRSISRVSLSNFSLQFGAFREQARAAELVRQLKTPPAGTPPITATIASEMRDGKVLYLVRAGAYGTLQEAETARARLIAKYPNATVFP